MQWHMISKSKRTPRLRMPSWAAGFLMLFAVPFIAVGVGLLIMSARRWQGYFESADWERVPARILKAELKHDTGGEGITYSVEAAYEYEYKGVRHEGTRVDIMGGSSSDSIHFRRQSILTEHIRSGKPFLAWVNPEDPSQSVLFRDLGIWGYALPLMGMIFGGAGLGLGSFGAWVYRRSRRRERLAKTHPGKPWLCEPDWGNFEARSFSFAHLLFAWAMALWVCVFCAPFVLFIASDEGASSVAKAAIGLFVAGAVAAVCYVVYKTRQYRKWGRARLVFTSLPFRPGDRFQGVVLCGRRVPASTGFRLNLLCSEDKADRTASESGVKRTELYEHQWVVERDLAGERGALGTAVPVDIPIPAEQPGSLEEKGRSIYWQLAVNAATPGINFSARFDVPIYDVQDESLIQQRPRPHTPV